MRPDDDGGGGDGEDDDDDDDVSDGFGLLEHLNSRIEHTAYNKSAIRHEMYDGRII